jgi:hypothetical protein
VSDRGIAASGVGPVTDKARRPRVTTIIALIGLIAAIGILAAENHVPDFLLHRLGQTEVISTARLDPPSLSQLPRLSYDSVLSYCELCRNVPAGAAENRTLQLAWLVSDESVTNSSRTADLKLPRLVWVVQWKDRCWSVPPVGVTGCKTFDIIDDHTGRELDNGQAWT